MDAITEVKQVQNVFSLPEGVVTFNKPRSDLQQLND